MQQNAYQGKSLTSWYAAQGVKSAQRALSLELRANGDHDGADFWEAKATGQTRAFTVEAFKASRASS